MAISIPQMNSFLCCSLKTATITIGIFKFLINLLYIVNITISSILYIRKFQRVKYEEIIGELLLEHSIFIQTLFCLLLIFGAYKEKSGFIMAWLLFGISEFMDNIWSTVLTSIMFFHWAFFIEYCIYLGINSLMMLVVYNLYRTMTKENYLY